MKYKMPAWVVVLLALLFIGVEVRNVVRDRNAWQDAEYVQGTISAIETQTVYQEEQQIVRVRYAWQGETVDGVIEGCPGGLHVGDTVDMKFLPQFPRNLRAAGYTRKINGTVMFLCIFFLVIASAYYVPIFHIRSEKRSPQDEKIWGLTRHVQAQVTDFSQLHFVQMHPGTMYHIVCRDREGRTFEKNVAMHSYHCMGLQKQWITVCIDPANEARFWFDIGGKLL